MQDGGSTDTSPTDEKLVERAKSGDKGAFDQLVMKYQSKLCAVVSRYMNDPTEVMDVTQEAFIKAYRALPGFRGDSSFYTWVYRITINTVKNYAVVQGRRPPDVDIDFVEAEQHLERSKFKESETPEGMLLCDEVQSTVLKAIEALPEDLCLAITLREVEGMSYEEIAEVMDCPIGTVRSRIFRAREAIDSRLRPLLQNE